MIPFPFVHPKILKKALIFTLNDLEPYKAMDEYISKCNLTSKAKLELKHKLELYIKKAQAEGIPLGVELGYCKNLEDAYLLRQRYINRLIKDLELWDSIYTLSSFALIAIIVVLLLQNI